MDGQKPTIDSIKPDTAWNTEGRPVPGYRIDFTTKNGVKSFVVLARTPDVHDKMRVAVSDEANKLDSLMDEHNGTQTTQYGQ